MREELLHYIWKNSRFDQHLLHTTAGEKLIIFNVGEHNFSDGPDFLQAKIMIGDTVWVGSVEIHLRASEWLHHQHQDDPLYQSVVLHVVLDEDKVIYRNNGLRIPCLVLRNRVPRNLPVVYEDLFLRSRQIPCEGYLMEVNLLHQLSWLDRCMVERLEMRMGDMEKKLAILKGNWEELLHQLLVASFGQHTNKVPFQRLAELLPLKLIARNAADPENMEALWFGIAGFLSDPALDRYSAKLYQKFRQMQLKYQLVEMPVSWWNFKGVRPSNFPTLRLAQLAAFYCSNRFLLDQVLSLHSISDFEVMMQPTLTSYWDTRYTFGPPVTKKSRLLGKTQQYLTLINAVIPFLFFFGTKNSQTVVRDRSLSFLESLPAEKNNIIALWQKQDIRPINAAHSQALLHLKKNYCDKRRCLDCAFGHTIFNRF